jgi:hypothetical protein
MEFESLCVKTQTMGAQVASVRDIAKDRVPYVRQVNSQLVPSPGYRPVFDTQKTLPTAKTFMSFDIHKVTTSTTRALGELNSSLKQQMHL